MKKTLKNFAAVLLCLSVVFSTCVFAFALGTVSKPKATAAYNSVTLSWSGVSGADGYEVYVASGKDWKKIATTDKTAYTHKNLKFNTTYQYRVRAYDKGLLRTTYGKASPTVFVKTALSAVKGLKVSAASETGFTLSWSKVAGATGYQIYTYSGGKWVLKTITAANSKSFTGAKLGVTYQYRVRAYRTVSGKTYYGSLSSAVSARCALTAPSSVKLSSVTASSATLSWKAVRSASGYQVYLRSGSGWVKKATVTANKATLKGLSAVTNYTVRVRSYKKVGSSYVYSAPTQFTFTTSYGSSSVNTKVMPSTLDGVCNVYNALVNNAKTEQNMTMHQTSTVSLTCTDCSVSFLQGTIDKLLQSFSTPTDNTVTVKNGVAKDQDGNRVDLNTYITPSGRMSALHESYVSSATVTPSSGGYKMTIKLKAEKASFDGTNTVNPVGHNSCLDPLNLAALELPASAELTEASMKYPGATLSVSVNSSGKLKKLTVKLPLSVSIIGELSDISITLALEGVMNEVYDFKY